MSWNFWEELDRATNSIGNVAVKVADVKNKIDPPKVTINTGVTGAPAERASESTYVPSTGGTQPVPVPVSLDLGLGTQANTILLLLAAGLAGYLVYRMG